MVHDFPQLANRFYLADAGYGLRKGILTPYKGVRYHLREQAKAAQQPKNKEELFNLRHAQLRNVIERIFGVFKKRFQILDKMPSYSFNVQVKLILVLVALHNFIRYRAHGIEDAIYAEADAEYEARSQQQQIERSGGGNHEGGMRGELAQREDRSMVELRERMATEMWGDYVIYMERQNRIFR